MALSRVIFTLRCPSQGDAEQVRDAVNSKLATKVLAKTNSAVAVELVEPTIWGVVADVAFSLRVDAADVRDDVVSKWSSGALRSRILSGSWVTLHDCSHNDGEAPPWQNCRDLQYEARAKAG